ncbi:MAG: large subunit ribosomal protein [Frankiaceae bacterium]|nr:large subunit ribosomal protein [Frankiaceae bacterium]MDX6224192.1 large subunit ribosomal protein [Frankiales bacterium]MDX6273694.1 large subunit ribosomal protein [Frankiales bacterium]
MSEVIATEPRTEFGKGAARRVRREGKVPGVLYGHGTEPRHVSLPGHDLMLALKHGGANTLLELDLGTLGKELALAKAVVRDPIKGFLEHIDLLLVRRGEKVSVDIPLHITGEIARDGLLETTLTSIPVEAEATNIPESIEVSVEGLQVGDAIHARDLNLPEGTTLTGDPDATVVHVLAAPTAEQMESEGQGDAPEPVAAPVEAAEAPAEETAESAE